jgi:hypothetical protein
VTIKKLARAMEIFVSSIALEIQDYEVIKYANSKMFVNY